MHLQSSLDESQLYEKQLKEKLDLQTEVLKNKVDELRILNEDTQSSSTSESMNLQKKVLELESIKVKDTCMHSCFAHLLGVYCISHTVALSCEETVCTSLIFTLIQCPKRMQTCLKMTKMDLGVFHRTPMIFKIW